MVRRTTKEQNVWDDGDGDRKSDMTGSKIIYEMKRGKGDFVIFWICKYKWGSEMLNLRTRRVGGV